MNEMQLRLMHYTKICFGLVLFYKDSEIYFFTHTVPKAMDDFIVNNEM
jgi:hypothetical protein